MAVPITGFTKNDILTELGIPLSNNISIDEMYNSDFIHPMAINPTYCPGNSYLDRLVNLKSKPYEIGKWRGYGLQFTPLPFEYSGTYQEFPFIWKFILDSAKYVVFDFQAQTYSDTFKLVTNGILLPQNNLVDISGGSYYGDPINYNYTLNRYPGFYFNNSGDNLLYLRIYTNNINTAWSVRLLDQYLAAPGSQVYNSNSGTIKGFWLTQNTGYVLNVSGGGANRDLSFKVVTSDSNPLPITDTQTSITYLEAVHTSNVNKHYSFTTPSGTNEVAIFVIFKVQNYGFEPLSYSFKVS